MIILSCATDSEEEMTQTTQIFNTVYLGDIVSSVSECINEVSLLIEQVAIFLLGGSCLQFIKTTQVFCKCNKTWYACITEINTNIHTEADVLCDRTLCTVILGQIHPLHVMAGVPETIH